MTRTDSALGQRLLNAVGICTIDISTVPGQPARSLWAKSGARWDNLDQVYETLTVACGS